MCRSFAYLQVLFFSVFTRDHSSSHSGSDVHATRGCCLPAELLYGVCFCLRHAPRGALLTNSGNGITGVITQNNVVSSGLAASRTASALNCSLSRYMSLTGGLPLSPHRTDGGSPSLSCRETQQRSTAVRLCYCASAAAAAVGIASAGGGAQDTWHTQEERLFRIPRAPRVLPPQRAS